MLKMVIEYDVKQCEINRYKNKLALIISTLTKYDADEIECLQSVEKTNRFVESFKIPTEAHYFAIKKLRLSKDHSVFGELDALLVGGLTELQFFAIKQC
ncbi:hypothetical protein [Mesobacillus harenae]|uniref:hypothetical protein n=1 Tax=Mesobacillus harenae TaxID=2213203 RepID=UPI0015804AF9|nr:hypothetical protein [Mesobacillus harenae]